MVAAETLAQATKIADDCAAIAAQVDRIGAYPSQEFEWIAQAGLLAVPLGKPWGRMAEAGSLPLLQLLKHLGRGNLSVGRIYEGHINALQLIQTFGTESQMARYATDASDDQRLFAVWNTEAADGVQILPLANGRYQLQGAKTFASGAGQVERPLITGRLPDGGGWQMIIVPMEQVQVEIDPTWWQPSGMRASASYRIDFSGVELTTEDLIGSPNDYRRQPWFSGGAIRFAAVQLGGAEALLNATRSHLQTLHRTEDPYQQARLGEMAIAVESGSLWLQGAAMIADDWLRVSKDSPQPEQANQIVAHADMTRSAIEQICLQVIQLAERSVGARGLLPPNPIERIIRDLTLYLRQPAPDAALANVGAYVLNSTVPVHALWDAND